MKPSFLTTARRLAASAALLLTPGALYAQSAPANDDFANRQVLPSTTQVTVSGTTTGATQEAFEKVYGAGQAYGDGINETNTVWYDYTAPVYGVLHLSLTRKVDSKTYVLVFKGGDTPVAANIVSQGYLPADVDENGPPPPDITVTAGQEYTISLGNTPPSPGFDDSFVLGLTLTPGVQPPPPASPTAGVTTKTPRLDRSGGQVGKLVFTLSSAATADVTLGYKVSGNAVAGTDYRTLPGSVTIPTGQTTATVKVKPRATAAAGTVGLKVKLQAGSGYTVGGDASAKIKLVGGE